MNGALGALRSHQQTMAALGRAVTAPTPSLVRLKPAVLRVDTAATQPHDAQPAERLDVARMNLSLPDELMALIARDLPGLNVSGVLQEALAERLDCKHDDQWRCARCGTVTDITMLIEDALSRFYDDILWEIGTKPCDTATGAARMIKRLALDRGITAANRVPLPRASRSQLEEAGRTNLGWKREHPEWVDDEPVIEERPARPRRRRSSAQSPDATGTAARSSGDCADEEAPCQR